MSELQASPAEISIHLVAADGGERDYRVPEGTTLADFLRRWGNSTEDRAIFVDGAPSEETLPLRPGAVVTVAPRTRIVAGREPWRATVPAFQDEDLFREYLEAIEARRRDDDEDRGA